MWMGLSHSGFVSWRFRRRDVLRQFTVFLNLILQSQLFNSVLSYFLLSCLYWGDFPPHSSLLYWADTFSCQAQTSMTFARVKGEPERPPAPEVEKENIKRKLKADWSQGRLKSGTKSVFNPSFGSKQCPVNILYGHYKCLYFIACYIAVRTASALQFPWYLQKDTFWRKRLPLRSYRLQHRQHLTHGSPRCGTKGGKQYHRVAPSRLPTALCFKTAWKNSKKLQDLGTNYKNSCLDLTAMRAVLSFTGAGVNKS